MSLRDYFAGQAVTTLMRGYSAEQARDSGPHFAEAAYAIADAMIAERAKE
jgi:hypothetical protein